MGKNSYLYREPDFDGKVLFYELNGTFINGWKYTNGKITGSIAPVIEEDTDKPQSRAWVEDCYTDYDYEIEQVCEDDYYIEYDEEYGESYVIESHCWDEYVQVPYEVCDEYWEEDEDNWEEDYPIGGSNTSHNDGNNDNQQSEPVSKDPIELMDKSKFVGWHNGANCLTLAQQTLKNYGITNYGSSDNVFRLVYEHNGKLENWGNDPKTNYENAIRCIDEHLNANRPIIVGVDYIPGYEKNEGTTDHFVVITGRGYDNATDEYYYTFMDNATSNADKGCSNDNRFYYTEGLTDFGGTSTVWEKEGYYYTVSQVRPNNGKQYETTSATN